MLIRFFFYLNFISCRKHKQYSETTLHTQDKPQLLAATERLLLRHIKTAMCISKKNKDVLRQLVTLNKSF